MCSEINMYFFKLTLIILVSVYFANGFPQHYHQHESIDTTRDRGVHYSSSQEERIRDLSDIQNEGSGIQNHGSEIQNQGSEMQNHGGEIQNQGQTVGPGQDRSLGLIFSGIRGAMRGVGGYMMGGGYGGYGYPYGGGMMGGGMVSHDSIKITQSSKFLLIHSHWFAVSRIREHDGRIPNDDGMTSRRNKY